MAFEEVRADCSGGGLTVKYFFLDDFKRVSEGADSHSRVHLGCAKNNKIIVCNITNPQSHKLPSIQGNEKPSMSFKF